MLTSATGKRSEIELGQNMLPKLSFGRMAIF